MNTIRQRILDAAERVIRTKGLAAASTREIAREAGCADGTLYNHFADRVDLFVAVVLDKLPDFTEAFSKLPYQVGEGTVQSNLEAVAQVALSFHYQTAPLSCSLFAEPELLRRYHEALKAQNRGPYGSVKSLEAYLRAEQRLGRVDARADPLVAAAMLMGTCFWEAYRIHFRGETSTPESDRHLVEVLVQSLMGGLAPREPQQ